MINGLQEVDQAFGVADAVVVFNAQENAVLAGVIAAFSQACDGPLVGLRSIYALGLAAGEYADMRRAQHGGMVDPFLHIGNLCVARVSFGQGKIIADGGAADFHPSQKRVSAQGDEVVACDVVAKKVTGQLRAIAAVIGTEVDELEHVHRLGLYLTHVVFLKLEK